MAASKAAGDKKPKDEDTSHEPARPITSARDPERTCLYASLRVLPYRNHTHGGYVLDVATLTAGKKHGEHVSNRNQFNITPQGIVHKPTEAAFIPHPGNPHSGIVHLGQLGNQRPNGNHYEPEDVQRMMRELWEEFVAKNPDMFKT